MRARASALAPDQHIVGADCPVRALMLDADDLEALDHIQPASNTLTAAGPDA
jgi:hypothetical protein